MCFIHYISPSSYPQPHLFSLYEALLVRVPQDGLNLLVDLLQAAGGELESVLIGPTGGHYVLGGLTNIIIIVSIPFPPYQRFAARVFVMVSSE